MRQLYKWLRDNSLLILFLCLFLGSFVGQSISGVHSDNKQRSANHKPALSYVQYLGTGNFLDGIFTNWQAALLQLGCLIFFEAELYEKGASHSRKPERIPTRKSASKAEDVHPRFGGFRFWV